MRFDRKSVFDGVRADFGKLDDVQVSVVAAMLDEFERRKLPDMRWLSYMLATGWGESQWKPVSEIGLGKGKKYGKPVNGKVYYGRGCPTQITWEYNYKKLGELLNLPLLDDPGMALLVPVGVAIGFEGMIRGVFTGKSLGHYFNETVDDPVNARRIINGTDKAKLFAGYHHKILITLGHAVRLEARPSKPAELPRLDAQDLGTGGPDYGELIANKITPTVIAGGGAVIAGFQWWEVAMIASGVGLVVIVISYIINKESKAND